MSFLNGNGRGLINLRKGILFFSFSFFYLLPLFLNIGKVQAKKTTVTLKIGIFDTPFCLSKIIKGSKNISIMPSFYPHSFTSKKDCFKKGPGQHGHEVLGLLLKSLGPSIQDGVKVEVYPYIIFNEKGIQTLKNWKEAIDSALEKELDILLLAVGLPSPLKIELENFPLKAFIASGQMGGKIKKETFLWPQSIKKKGHLIMIGSYLPPVKDLPHDYLKDQTLLYSSKIQYYFSGGEGGEKLTGSSRAVVLALARAIQICQISFFKQKEISQLRECLSQNKKTMKYVPENDHSLSKKDLGFLTY